MPGAAVALALPPGSAVTAAPSGPYITDENGQVTVRFTSSRAGTYTVEARVGGGSITPGPKEIEFEAVRVDLSSVNTWFTVSEEPVVADGVDVGVLTVQLWGNDGEPFVGVLDGFEVAGPAGSGLVFGSLAALGNGVYAA